MALMMLMMIVFVLDRHLQAKKALQRPEKLLAEFQTVNGSLEGLFSWQVSETTPGQTPITGFQFSWVKVSSRCVNKSLDTSLISQTLNLAPVSLKAFIRHVFYTFITNSVLEDVHLIPLDLFQLIRNRKGLERASIT